MQKLHGLFEADLDPNKDDTLSTGSDCHLDSGGILIKLPLQLRASHFRIGFGNCGSWTFRNWVFEAYSENENMWHTLYNSGGVSPWADEFEQYRMGELKVFPADGSFGASQFRLRLIHDERGPGDPDDWSDFTPCQCMHIRGFELYGKILPPWRID